MTISSSEWQTLANDNTICSCATYNKLADYNLIKSQMFKTKVENELSESVQCLFILLVCSHRIQCSTFMHDSMDFRS